MEAQGYTIENKILYQDKTFTVLLAKNRRMKFGKNRKHIKNMFFFITNNVVQRELDICHLGTKYIWADVNIKPVQGAILRIFRSEMMGVPVEYNDDVEQRRTHPLLLPKIETERLSLLDGDILEKVAAVVPVKKLAKTGPVYKKGTVRGSKRKSISPKAKPSEKRRSFLGEPKYGPGSEPHWKVGSAQYQAFYKALLDKPSRNKRIDMVRVVVLVCPRGTSSIKMAVLILLVRVST